MGLLDYQKELLKTIKGNKNIVISMPRNSGKYAMAPKIKPLYPSLPLTWIDFRKEAADKKRNEAKVFNRLLFITMWIVAVVIFLIAT